MRYRVAQRRAATQSGLTQVLARSMQETWYFIAMQYYGLILNRTYFISVESRRITGKVCRGLTAVESGSGLTRLITSHLAVHEDLADPQSYVSELQLSRTHRADFTLNYADIRSISFNPKKKWGMGHYPHDGRVVIVTAKNRLELIILGNQSGKVILDRLSDYRVRAG